jgi:hypothetical protein
LLPAKTTALYNSFTIPQGWDDSPFVDKLIRFYLTIRAKQEEQEAPGKLEEIHRNFWAKTDAYFTDTDNRTEAVFIPAYGDIVQDMVPLLAEKQIDTVCEFGTGDGKWLDYLAGEWTAVSQFIGIDIAAHQIEINQQQYPRLTFHHADLVKWLEKNAAGQTLYHTNGGVLEYLSEESVRHLFDIIKTDANRSLVLLNEPLYGDFDIKTDKTSKVLGYENSYSHNYVHLLQTAGAQILRYEERAVMDYRMLLVLAYFSDES